MCKVQKNKQKEINLHYTTKHKELSRCKLCNRSYRTPYSLRQHMYSHRETDKLYKCITCQVSFPFISQLRIHLLKHRRKPKFECMECMQVYKYRHDMLKHSCEHNAPVIKC